MNLKKKQKGMSSELLLRVYMSARTKAQQPRPVRTHYNAATFG